LRNPLLEPAARQIVVQPGQQQMARTHLGRRRGHLAPDYGRPHTAFQRGGNIPQRFAADAERVKRLFQPALHVADVVPPLGEQLRQIALLTLQQTQRPVIEIDESVPPRSAEHRGVHKSRIGGAAETVKNTFAIHI